MNRKGYAIMLTLTAIIIIMLLGVFVISFTQTESYQVMRLQHRTQAKYIARSGVLVAEAAILEMSEDAEELNELNNALESGELTSNNNIFGNGRYDITISKQDDGTLLIVSEAYVRNVKETMERVMGLGEPIIVAGESYVNFDMAVMTKGGFNLTNGTINGDAGSMGEMSISGNPTINGKALLVDTSLFTKPSWWDKVGSVESIEPREVPMPIFPEFPDLEEKPNIKTSWNNSNFMIDSSGYYDTVHVANWGHKVTIDTTDGDKILVVDTLDIDGSLEILGNNKVKIYVNSFDFDGPSMNNSEEGNQDRRQLEVYYAGTEKLYIGGSSQLNGSIYTKTSDLALTNGGRIYGNIVVGGESLVIDGGSMQQKGVVYAPNALVEIAGSGDINGAVVANEVLISGGASITYVPENTEYMPIQVDVPLDFVVGEKPYVQGYFK